MSPLSNSLKRAVIRGVSTSSSQLSRTGLYDFHISHGAKMVPFAGYSMPLSYGDVGQMASHKHVRSSVGLFDVGHMVQHKISGSGALDFLQYLTPSSLSSLSEFQSTLSVLLNEDGGIIDDTVVSRHPDSFYVVTNAGRRVEDLEWIQKQLEDWNDSGRPQVKHEVMEHWGLVALQGPQSATILQKLTDADLTKLTFGNSAFMKVNNTRVHVARGGYTGEDGFEISIPPESTVELTEALLGEDDSSSPVQLAGLGARDSLRLEAGLCLYGHDLNEATSPVEAALSWVIGKDRRQSGGFIGSAKVLEHLQKGEVPRKRIGLVITGAPAREGALIFHPETSQQIGAVTSGIPSPTLGQNIAMGYVKSGPWTKAGSKLEVEVRNKKREAVVSKMPFVPTKYYRGAEA